MPSTTRAAWETAGKKLGAESKPTESHGEGENESYDIDNEASSIPHPPKCVEIWFIVILNGTFLGPRMFVHPHLLFSSVTYQAEGSGSKIFH